MKYDTHNINKAIVAALGDLWSVDEKSSAKDLRGTLGSFFFVAAGGGTNYGPDKDQEPEGYCHPYRSELAEIRRMCEAISAECWSEQGQNRKLLIRRIWLDSKELMSKFRVARDNGDYKNNPGYICELDGETDWGRQMLALEATFFPDNKADV